MGKLLKDLVLAMINATLILVIVALILGLRLTDRVETLTASFARSLVSLTPVAQELEATRAEVVALRADIANAVERGAALPEAAAARLDARLALAAARLDGIEDTVGGLADAPERMARQMVSSAADEAVAALADLRGCTPAPET